MILIFWVVCKLLYNNIVFRTYRCIVLLRMGSYLQLLFAIMVPVAGGWSTSTVMAGQVRRPGGTAWYQRIRKPVWTPRNSVFAPVWAVLYTTMGTASYLVYNSTDDFDDVKVPLALYGMQLLLNFCWTPIFFGLHWLKTERGMSERTGLSSMTYDINPHLASVVDSPYPPFHYRTSRKSAYYHPYIVECPKAFVEMLLLDAAAVVCTCSFYGRSPAAALLLAPYLAWLAFASYLNYVVWRMNEPTKSQTNNYTAKPISS